MVKLELLSSNLMLILNTILGSGDSKLVKYLNYDKLNPLAEPNLSNPKTLMFKNVFPWACNPFTTLTDASQLHVYFDTITLKDRVVENCKVYFDIIVAKKLWLINTGESKIRPYEIASELVTMFDEQSIGTLGELKFISGRQLAVNEKFDAFQLTAKVTSYSH
jgi:hypothetical protein